MIMDKAIKILLSFSIVIFILGSFYTKSIATNVINPDDYNPGTVEIDDKANKKSGIVLGYIRNIGIVISIISLMIIGIRSMIGSSQEKSEYKESLGTFVIGVFILLACTTIPSLIYNAMSG